MAIQAMSKKSQREAKRQVNSAGVVRRSNAAKNDPESALKLAIGPANVKRWNALKIALRCQTDEQFTAKLLDLAQDHLNRSPCKEQNGVDEPKQDDNQEQPQTRSKRKRSEAKKHGKSPAVNVVITTEHKPKLGNIVPDTKQQENVIEPFPDNVPRDEPKKETPVVVPKAEVTSPVAKKPSKASKQQSIPTQSGDKKKPPEKKPPVEPSHNRNKKSSETSYDVRKAPELEIQIENNNFKTEPEYPSDLNRVAIKIKLCQNCGTRHIQDHCPLNYPNFVICDSLTPDEWRDRYQSLHDEHVVENASEKENGDQSKDDGKFSFAKLSLPGFLVLGETTCEHGLGVWTRADVQEFTQFGPLLGKTVKEVDIPEDSTMRDLWEISVENGSNLYFNTEDPEVSNWMRFVRPAPARDEKNLTVIVREGQLFFITSRPIKADEELLYWQDSVVAANKKKMERTSCGGCNMTFTHPFYYRTHCSVFHDVRYSLTIRKYHCKVCGAAVLGKENIMKHAAELHNGRGAYQCRFCKKFFLRLNYLEMHRTYGCSANPHRSRPLCDFCGRKFCQPQKLKVHIKRMHSDFAEVLKEFQCKNCLKILGSRAALQRHLKEVHQKQVAMACSCSRCGKHFQNKSNLKIHMLTHSGIKPFKCVVKSCNAAFTTKQCLQFHYKKVHNFNEEVMPKIERSIDYTFEAYSGVEDQEMDGSGDGGGSGLIINKDLQDASNMQNDSTSATFDGDSDLDDNSMDSCKNLDDPPAMHSPLQEASPLPPEPTTPPPAPPPPPPPPLDSTFNTMNATMKILSKGSKKWIGDLKQEIYPPAASMPGKDELSLQQEQSYDRSSRMNLDFRHQHEASNASLLVEAALDSVCSEPNIDVDVTTPNCTDALNLYTLAPPDALPDVTYSEINEQRDINLISPSVNDHISVTDELNDELRHNQNIGMDYSGFHQEPFSPANSPEMHHRSNFVRNYINNLSPQYVKNASPNPVPSPPRYDFGTHPVNNTEHLSSDDSNGMAAQNLSLHSKHDNIQLDLSIYKSPYKLEVGNKNFSLENSFQRNRTNSIGVDDDNLDNQMSNQDLIVIDMKDKEENDQRKYPDDSDIRASKFDIDLDLRIGKNYDIEGENLRSRGLYESDLDFRNKAYDMIDKNYDTTVETDFRTDRNFEPLVLNSSELQGLDMSARSFHNYPNINRYHHLYSEVDRVDLRLNYSPPPPPSYTHADLLRVVSLDLTPPGRHSVDLSLRTHPLHPSRLLDTNPHLTPRLLSSDLSARHLSGLSAESTRILSDHTTNRILANNDQLSTNHLLSSDQRLLPPDDSRMISEQPRLLEQSRLMGDGRMLTAATPSGAVSPVPAFTGYSVSQSPYHPTPLAPRPHVSSPTPTPYHHYSSYY